MEDRPQQSSALDVSGLAFAYADGRMVLSTIDLSIMPGERVGLIGPNGAGKTTLFLLFSGVLRPQAGSIRLFGKGVTVGAFYPDIGMVFQNPNDQLFCASVWEDVAFGPRNLGLPAQEVSARVEAALTTTGMQHLAGRPPHQLSGGEKRMVAIAGVLAMQPRLVIYDEPGASLDLRARRRLIGFLQESSQTLLVSSHDLELLLEVCDRVILLDAGRIVADGAPDAVMGDAGLMEAHGLERPLSLSLLQR